MAITDTVDTETTYGEGNMTKNCELGKAIELYQRWGISIIPIAPKSKKPLVDWKPYQHRKPDNAELGDWWDRYWSQGANIGVVCGQVSGNFLVLDFDREESFQDFAEAWKVFRGREVFVETPVVATGKGFHVYVRIRDLPPTYLPQGEEKLRMPEIRAEGTYVVVPPSIHPSGDRYQFVNPEVDQILEIEDLSEVGIELPASPTDKGDGHREHKEPNWAVEALQGVPEGERDNTAVKLAGRYKAKGLESEETLLVLKDWAARCCPPFSEKEVEKCVRSAYSYPHNETGKSSGLRLVWARDMEVSDDGYVDPLWGDFFFPSSIHLFSGEAGVGKTTFLYNLAIKGAKGEPFLEIPFSKALRTLYLDLESPDRLQRQKLNLIAEGDPPGGLAFIVSLNLERDLAEIISLVIEHGFDLVVVDTINEAFETEDEDSNAEANRQMQLIRQLVQMTGCAVILVHHLGKRGQERNVYKSRGASARAASADVVVNLEGLTEDTIKLEMAKNRWVGGKSTLFLRKVGEDRFELTSQEGEETASEKYKAQGVILEMLQSGAMQRKDIIDRVVGEGYAKPTVERALSDLVQSGRVKRLKRGVYGLHEAE